MRTSYVVIAISTRFDMDFQTIYTGNNKADADKAYDNCRDTVRMEAWQNGQQIAVKMK